MFANGGCGCLREYRAPYRPRILEYTVFHLPGKEQGPHRPRMEGSPSFVRSLLVGSRPFHNSSFALWIRSLTTSYRRTGVSLRIGRLLLCLSSCTTVCSLSNVLAPWNTFGTMVLGKDKVYHDLSQELSTTIPIPALHCLVSRSHARPFSVISQIPTGESGCKSPSFTIRLRPHCAEFCHRTCSSSYDRI